MDNFSMELGKLSHQQVKEYYRRASKIDYVEKVSKVECHIGKMEHTAQYMSAEQLQMEAPSKENLVGMGDPATSYHMASMSHAWSLISGWELEDPNDWSHQVRFT
ncbi:hypothetical protein DACRYDRAFT_111078 [Dacryopinax primogenitus]|uniref:Uncharacterized protein n=1 Tax=Dacryopinax primogenitus (strain DJM 731) TaxID=1858805 RepID=M5FR58_DACPD|nr:uncharacterized protein DACRYDRAFT_111078 [Dacryopinax primogenitus]EJT98098.1 hypothetical protein DACRYDRAFT_111078 [Dacryopinax primogenitus]